MKKFFRPLLAAIAAIILMVQPCLAATDIYTVQPGDSLWTIAKKYKVGLSEIIGANDQLQNPNMIYPGQRIAVPLPDPGIASVEAEVVALCNAERKKAGLKPLSINWEVARVARYKSEDMKKMNYFSHESPVYGSPFDMLKSFNIKYKTAGENIAKGQRTAQAVVTAWMNSPGHKANILNASYTETGVGFCEGNNTTYWTMIFIS